MLLSKLRQISVDFQTFHIHTLQELCNKSSLDGILLVFAQYMVSIFICWNYDKNKWLNFFDSHAPST